MSNIHESENYVVKVATSVYGEKELPVYQIVNRITEVIEQETTVYPNAMNIVNELEGEIKRLLEDADDTAPPIFNH